MREINWLLKPASMALLPFCISLAFLPAHAQTAAPAAAPVVKYDLTYDIISPVMAKNGIVASEQELATQVGIDILKRGGGFMMIHDAKTGKNVALDFREMAPAKASRDMYLDDQGNVVPGRSLYTHLAVGVPGTVAGLTHALKKYGTMKLSDVIAPAVRLAEKGYPVSPNLVLILAAERDHLGQWESSKAIFFKDGRPLKAGEMLVGRW